MSLVVAVRYADHTEMCSDLGTYFGSTVMVGGPKVTTPCPGVGAGVVGSVAWCTLVLRDTTWPDLGDLDAESYADVARAALGRSCADVEYTPRDGDNVLLVVRGRLYYLQGVESVDYIDHPYWAIGSGADYVLGLLEWVAGYAAVPTPALASFAVEIAERVCLAPLAVEIAGRVCAEVRGATPTYRIDHDPAG